MTEKPARVIAIVQARMGSTRLPGKVLKSIAGRPSIDLLLERLGRASTLSQIVVATSYLPQDDELAKHLFDLGIEVYRGSEQDVLGRYAAAAKQHNAEVVVRITGDCPFVDPDLVDSVVGAYLSADVDYCSNVCPPTFPDGMDVEVFGVNALYRADLEAKAFNEREHVTSYLIDGAGFRRRNLAYKQNLSHIRLTLDDPSDLESIDSIASQFAPRTDMGWEEIVNLMNTHSEKIKLDNQSTRRNEGSEMGSGQKLWKRAKAIIPGGNMLLSKRSEMFLPDQWPSYFSRTSGCSVWDLDGNHYLDMGVMGVGTNTLGYSHPEIDAAVVDVVSKGNLCTLNAPEEVYLAERLVELHPWSDMVRFARTGGEANAIGIRIARAAAGREGVAICGYHGWHDWYLAANLGQSENLDGHLLPGLEPRGVPRELTGTVHPFMYNDFGQLKKIVETESIGVIKMEVMRNADPKDGFLEKVRALATEKGIVLVFDECTSGFRETYGGLHKKFGVEPDMAIFGKTLGNGYAVTAIIGREEVMQAAQSTFVSSTFWTERIGSVAALKTLEVMERESSWDQITEIGKRAIEGWNALSDSHGIEIEVAGLPSIATYNFKSARSLEYCTYLTQEMLDKGYLASTCLYACLDHTESKLADYFEALDSVYSTLAKCERDEQNIFDLLKGPVCHSRFSRLN